MGGYLLSPPDGGRPTFVINAVADPITGHPLQRIEIIKGWVDEQGEGHTQVVTVVGDASGPSPSATCSVPTTNEPERLCGRYVDSSFVPGQRAFYYARVLENPSCRWSTWRCVEQGVTCSELDPTTGTFIGDDAGYEGSCSILREGLTYVGTDRFDTVEERAITSPVWWEPQ